MAVFDQTGPGIRGTWSQVRVLQTLPGQTYCRKTLLPVLDNSHDDEFQRKRLSKRQGTEEGAGGGGFGVLGSVWFRLFT